MKQLLDLYTDYLISSFYSTTATGLSRLVDNAISHDTITRFLSEKVKTSADLWKIAKPLVRSHGEAEGSIIIDDTIEEKPYTDESELVTWHFDHTQGKSVKGIQILSAVYATTTITVPVAFDTVRKTETVVDQKTGKTRHKSPETKNQKYRNLLRISVNNEIPFHYVLNDVWYSAADNMNFIKNDLKKDFIMPIKSNRKVALNLYDKHHGSYQGVASLAFEAEKPILVYLEQVEFPLLLVKQIFINGDGSSGILYLVSSETTLGYDQITTFYQKRWKIEVYHKSLKSNLALAKSPTRTTQTQTNHLFASLCAFIKLETIKVETSLNHFAIKAKIYLRSLQAAFQELHRLHPEKMIAFA
jgi:hypothetical protein